MEKFENNLLTKEDLAVELNDIYVNLNNLANERNLSFYNRCPRNRNLLND